MFVISGEKDMTLSSMIGNQDLAPFGSVGRSQCGVGSVVPTVRSSSLGVVRDSHRLVGPFTSVFDDCRSVASLGSTLRSSSDCGAGAPGSLMLKEVSLDSIVL